MELSIGIDPLTRNRYSYVNGDPVNFLDSDGHEPCPLSGCTYREHGQGPQRERRNEARRYGNQVQAARRVEPFTVRAPEGMSQEEVKRYVALAADGADIAEAGLELCKHGRCGRLKTLVGVAGHVGDAVSIGLECYDGWDVNCSAVVADWGLSFGAVALGGPVGGAVYIVVREAVVPILGNMLRDLQEQTPSATPIMNDGSFRRYQQEDGTMVFPSGSGNSPYNCASGMAMGPQGS